MGPEFDVAVRHFKKLNWMEARLTNSSQLVQLQNGQRFRVLLASLLTGLAVELLPLPLMLLISPVDIAEEKLRFSSPLGSFRKSSSSSLVLISSLSEDNEAKLIGREVVLV